MCHKGTENGRGGGGNGIAAPSFKRCSRCGWVVKATIQPLYPKERDHPSNSALDAGWWPTPQSGRFTPGKETRYPLYRGMNGLQVSSGRARKISPPTGIRSPARPVRSESLYRVRYPDHQLVKIRQYIGSDG
jgi:hypothetical protein